jgi:ATP-dependent Zn protease
MEVIIMNIKILFIGTIYAVAKKAYNDEETVYAQFLNKTENGGVEIQQVKITEQNDLTHIKEGQNIKIPVKISSYQNKIYFTQIEPMVK